MVTEVVVVGMVAKGDMRLLLVVRVVVLVLIVMVLREALLGLVVVMVLGVAVIYG